MVNETQRHRAAKLIMNTDSTDLRDFSLALVIEISKILKICGQRELMFQLMSKLMSELMCYEKDALRRNIN